MVKPMEKIWMDGNLVNWNEATVHVMAHSLHYGDGVFEGIRIYKCSDGRSAIFRLGSHVRRLFCSATALEMVIPFAQSEIEEAVIETVKINKLEEGYIRPIAFFGEGDMGPLHHNNPVRLAIISWEWGSYLGKEALERGISVMISSYRRVSSAMPFKAKVCGNYVNAALAKREAEKYGYKDAIILDEYGNVAEGSAENIFMVKKEYLVTPHLDLPILRGITRDTVFTLAIERMGISNRENLWIDPEMLVTADEVFFSGTAAEITPIREIGDPIRGREDRTIGKACPGPITKKIQELYFKTLRGELPEYGRRWLTYV